MSESKVKIMVVDDEPDMIFTVSAILEDAGYEVFGAEDGYQAIELASQEDIALVFMDINLPGIDGVEAYRKIKEVSPGTAVIMMTGFAVESLISQALAEGAYTVLYKPLDINTLLLAVHEILDSPCLLVVDDEVGSRESMRLIFEDLGYRVAMASNGSQAIDHVESKHYDVILMDVGMPGIDGFEACRRIVELDPATRVIFVTAHEVDQCAGKALLAGAFSILSKPVEPEHMVALVDAFVGLTRDAAIGSDEAVDGEPS
ncbi:MAG: response regulator [SAR202 cluster bacterium]|nr:response regulator [SAR202 cluster bacterium]